MMCGGGNVIGGDRSFTWLNGLIWIHVQQGENERGCLKKYDFLFPSCLPKLTTRKINHVYHFDMSRKTTLLLVLACFGHEEPKDARNGHGEP